MNASSKAKKGSAFLEIVVACGLFVVICTSLLPYLSILIRSSAQVNQQLKLTAMAEYVGEYITRWANFSPDAKFVAFEYYDENGWNELELSGDKRINRFQWGDKLVETSTDFVALEDEYKATIRFWETDRVDRAVVAVAVWYDADLDDEIDTDEKAVSFSTVLTEKQIP